MVIRSIYRDEDSCVPHGVRLHYPIGEGLNTQRIDSSQ